MAKFVPRTNLKGLKASVHEVRTTSGFLLLDAKNSYPKPKRDDPFAKVKLGMMNRLPRQEGSFRAIMNKAIYDFDTAVLVAEHHRGRLPNGKLKSDRQAIVEAKLRQIVSNSMNQISTLIQNNMRSSVKTYLRTITAQSPNKLLSMAEVNNLSSLYAEEAFNERYGSSGMNVEGRMAGLAGRLEIELRKFIDLSWKERQEKKKVLRRNLVDPKGSDRPCVARGAARINRTEQQRAVQKAALRVLEDKGVTLAYWRLSASHKDYGGNEVCEVLASSTGARVEDLVMDRPIDLTGCYRVDDFPLTPHPNCMCNIVPIY